MKYEKFVWLSGGGGGAFEGESATIIVCGLAFCC